MTRWRMPLACSKNRATRGTKATPEERAAIAGTLFSEVRIRDQAIVSATPANPAYLPLIASMTARNDAVGMAPLDGLGGSESKAFDPLAWFASA